MANLTPAMEAEVGRICDTASDAFPSKNIWPLTGSWVPSLTGEVVAVPRKTIH